MGGGAATAIVAAIVGLVVGYGVSAVVSKGKVESQVGEVRKEAMMMKQEAEKKEAMMKEEAMKQSEDAAMAKKTDTKAADLRVLINAIERQHVNLASAAVRSGFDGRKDFEAVAKSLDENSVALSKAVGSVYGPDAEKKFLDIWRSHIGFFVDYTLAAKKGDKAGMEKAVQNLGGYADAIADLLSKANPNNLPREAVKSLVLEHVGLLKGAVDAYGAGKYPDSYAQQAAADAQIGKIADALSGAIVKQFPEKF